MLSYPKRTKLKLFFYTIGICIDTFFLYFCDISGDDYSSALQLEHLICKVIIFATRLTRTQNQVILKSFSIGKN